MGITRLKNVNFFQGSDKSSRKFDRAGVFVVFFKTILHFLKHKELINNMFHFIPSHGNSFYICKTCAQKFKKLKFHVNLFVISYTFMVSQ